MQIIRGSYDVLPPYSPGLGPDFLSYWTNTGVVGPHGATIRLSRTVPANTRMVLLQARLSVIRVTAATAVARYGCYMRQGSNDFAPAVTISNAVDGRVDLDSYIGAMFEPGDVVEALTFDISTGGTVLYELSFTTLEFLAVPA